MSRLGGTDRTGHPPRAAVAGVSCYRRAARCFPLGALRCRQANVGSHLTIPGQGKAAEDRSRRDHPGVLAPGPSHAERQQVVGEGASARPRRCLAGIGGSPELMAPATLTWLGERKGNTGRSGPGRTPAGPGGRLAMGEALTIGARHEPGYAIVTIGGEIDIATVTRLREGLAELAASGCPLVADLDQVKLHRFSRAQRPGRRGQPRRRIRRQPARGLRPAEDPPAVPPDRAGSPDTAGPHPGRGPGGPGREDRAIMSIQAS